MEKINWKIRLLNPDFWLSAVPLICLLAVQVSRLFGMELDLSDLATEICDIVTTIFMLLALVGIINDPTTKGLADSVRALGKERAD